MNGNALSFEGSSRVSLNSDSTENRWIVANFLLAPRMPAVSLACPDQLKSRWLPPEGNNQANHQAKQNQRSCGWLRNQSNGSIKADILSTHAGVCDGPSCRHRGDHISPNTANPYNGCAIACKVQKSGVLEIACFRRYFEAVGLPTGSESPQIHGNHRRVKHVGGKCHRMPPGTLANIPF